MQSRSGAVVWRLDRKLPPDVTPGSEGTAGRARPEETASVSIQSESAVTKHITDWHSIILKD